MSGNDLNLPEGSTQEKDDLTKLYTRYAARERILERLLKNADEQGVLLLNACLTVPAGQANGHAGQVWEPFTDAVIKVLNQKDTPVVFILWGGYARKKKALETNPKHAIIESAHPSPLSAYRGFFGSKPFSKANAYLVSQGQSPIDWLK